MHIPPADITKAKENGLRFEVTTRERAPLQWITFVDDIESLEEAFTIAEGIDEDEIAIWVKSKFGNSRYWTKATPDLFNSVVLDVTKYS